MAGSTPIYGFPYPESSDLVANYPALGQDLAEDIEGVIAALPPGGLVHIATESFSAVSSVSLNGVFTSDYENYFLTIKAATAAGTPFMRMRLRASGSDNTTANSYRQQLIQSSSTTLTGSRGTNDFTNFALLDTANTHTYATVFNPQLAIVTAWYSTSNVFPAGNIELYQFAGGHNQTASYDGLTIYPSSSTFTGTIRVYGYQNS